MNAHAQRRANPRIWDSDWHVLRGQGQAIRALLGHPAVALAGAAVLDYGCGSRPYEAWFTAAGARYQGADLDGAHEVPIRANGTLAAPGGSVDLVASFSVLEHVWDVATYLGEARRVLKPGGWLLLSTHGNWFYHPHPGDYRRWTREGLQREVQAHGFRLQEMRAVVGPLAWTSILRAYGAGYALRGVPLVGAPLAGAVAVAYNAGAWLADCVTPAKVTADNACIYVGLFRCA